MRECQMTLQRELAEGQVRTLRTPFPLLVPVRRAATVLRVSCRLGVQAQLDVVTELSPTDPALQPTLR